MEIEKAIEILHPDTTFKAITEIEYYGGFKGKEKAMEAINEACVVACECMEKTRNGEKKIEFAIATIGKNKVVPKIFQSEEEAEKYRLQRHNPSNWKVVKREVIYGEWQ